MESRNVIAALSLSFLILIGWHYFFEKPRLEQQYAARQEADAGKPLSSIPNVEENDLLKEEIEEAGHDEKDTKHVSPRVVIASPRLHGSILLKGARFDDVKLADYHQEYDKESPEVVLLTPARQENTYFAEIGWVSPDKKLVIPNENTVWKADKDRLQPGENLQLTWLSPQSVLFQLDISLDENFLFTIRQTVINKGHHTISLIPYGRINRKYEKPSETFAILHEGLLGVTDNVLTEMRYEDLQKTPIKEFKKTEGWFGMTDKYWLTALIPDTSMKYNVRFMHNVLHKKDHYQVDYVGEAYALKEAEHFSVEQKFFAGAKELHLLDAYAKKDTIPLFDRAVDFGWLYFVTKPLFLCLTFLNKLTGNFGLAIIALTFLVKLLMFPLAQKSYVGMNQIKKLQPRLAAMREKYPDDKIAFNQAVMELYKKEKVNPMSGCLPLLIQIPVFFALYKVFFVTIEMRHAPFYGWIHDLSAPDPTNIFNLFGLLPFSPPSFIPVVSAWALLMALTMFIQQKLGPEPTDPIQAKMMKLLPLIFIFLFASFPVGLLIYWTVNNILTILQQYAITKTTIPLVKEEKLYGKAARIKKK